MKKNENLSTLLNGIIKENPVLVLVLALELVLELVLVQVLELALALELVLVQGLALGQWYLALLGR